MNTIQPGGLAAKEIKRLLKRGELIITPILDAELQIGRSSFDVRLGDEFIAMKRTTTSGLDIQHVKEIKRQIGEYQIKRRIEPFSRNGLVIHPGQIILASTLEYFVFPKYLIAYLIGRSSWGRLGLIVATATFIDPGYKGVIILELVNSGEMPITLYPGLRIAQLVFHKTTSPVPEGYRGKYLLQTGPMFSRIYDESEIELFINE